MNSLDVHREEASRPYALSVNGDEEPVGSSLDRVGWSPGHRHPVT